MIGYIAVIVVGGSLWVGLRSVYTVRQPTLTLNQVIVLARQGHIRTIYLDAHSNASHNGLSPCSWTISSAAKGYCLPEIICKLFSGMPVYPSRS